MNLMKKSTLLKNMIRSKDLEFIMEAHSGLSAKIVEEAGFKGIWGSGLSISASLGVRDNNEASWTQVLDVCEYMSDATTIPMLLDGDTGYGNFNNMRRLVHKLEQRNVAGVCIEDKLFPKTNSFISGETQPLADVDEFCGKIKAGRDSQTDPDFVIVARIEAFIAGWGLDEALRRGEAYRQAGADAVLVHSKKSNPSDIEAFMKEWAGRLPVVIVPTKYYSTPTDLYRNIGISMVIWANHNVRASIGAMQATTKKIFDDQSLINVEDKVVTVNEIFRLQNADELEAAEDKYLPASGKNVNAVILAASEGNNLKELTKDIPKVLLKVQGKTLLARTTDELNRVGIKDISVVRGYKKETIKAANIRTIDNDEYNGSKELYSFYLARNELKENTVIVYGDIVFKSYILNDLLNDTNDITILVDSDFQMAPVFKDYVRADRPYSKNLFRDTVKFMQMSTTLKAGEIQGEFVGLWKVNAAGAAAVKAALEALSKNPDFKNLRMADLFNEIAKSTPIAVKYIRGSWLDIDDVVALQKAGDL
jgi:phosphoenolpyruvate phosphomutase